LRNSRTPKRKERDEVSKIVEANSDKILLKVDDSLTGDGMSYRFEDLLMSHFKILRKPGSKTTKVTQHLRDIPNETLNKVLSMMKSESKKE